MAPNLNCSTGADPGFLERGGCLLFLNSITGKIIAEKSNYRGGYNPHNPSPKSASAPCKQGLNYCILQSIYCLVGLPMMKGQGA